MKLGCDVRIEEPKSRSAEIIWYWWNQAKI